MTCMIILLLLLRLDRVHFPGRVLPLLTDTLLPLSCLQKPLQSCYCLVTLTQQPTVGLLKLLALLL
jgi:hypothetical protein